MLPGIAPTGRSVEIPLVAIVHSATTSSYNEHIYWDQASVLVQIGELDPTGPARCGRRDRAQGAGSDAAGGHAGRPVRPQS